MADTTTIELAGLPRRWFRIAAIGCVALGVAMAALLLIAGAVAAAGFFLVFTSALAALAHGIARSTVGLGPGPTLAITNGYRRRTVAAGDVERVEVIRANERSTPRRVALVTTGGSRIQLLATDGAARSGDAVEALAAQIDAFLLAERGD